VHLGLETVRKILFAIEIIGIFKANSVMTFFNEVNFWKHSVAGALLAAEIIKASKSDDKEIAYLCGLFRNIGVLVIRQFLPKEFHQIHELIGKKSMPFGMASKETVGIDHREITYLLCMRWNLPDKIIAAMSELENKEPGKEPFLDTAIAVNCADAVLAAKGINEWDPFYRPVCGVDDEEAMKKAEEVIAQVEKMQQQLW
jgi:HD-like signal output (HDOD) protein